jgi:peptidoglycan hydrolase-like protein with peptidoglycan-binding domain/DNA invertase Pin-like site-specific DNA recombinase
MNRLACLALCSLALAPAPALAAPGRPETASWRGRAIEHAVNDGTSLQVPASFPEGWKAGQVRLGTGFHREGGSARVREVQRRLWALGFRPGPVDGLFGSQTKAAVEWFQVKHGLRPTGAVSLATLTVLRERTGAGSARTDAPGGADVRSRLPQPRPAAPRSPARAPAPSASHSGGGFPPSVFAAFAVLMLGVLLMAWRAGHSPQGRRRLHDLRTSLNLRTAPPKPRRRAATHSAAVAPAARSLPMALGYVRGDEGDELARNATAIERECSRRGWALGRLLRDDERTAIRSSSLQERPGLTQTLARLGRPGRSRLVVSRLGHLSRSAGDLRLLFDWFGRHEVGVVVLDVGIDTTTRDGRRAAQAVLTAIARRQARAQTNGNGNGNRRQAANLATANGNGHRPSGHQATERGDPG